MGGKHVLAAAVSPPGTSPRAFGNSNSHTSSNFTCSPMSRHTFCAASRTLVSSSRTTEPNPCSKAGSSSVQAAVMMVTKACSPPRYRILRVHTNTYTHAHSHNHRMSRRTQSRNIHIARIDTKISPQNPIPNCTYRESTVHPSIPANNKTVMGRK
jgi:hypothetical protein